jgi:DNA-binding CsgD family transcriptional regulator
MVEFAHHGGRVPARHAPRTRPTAAPRGYDERLDVLRTLTLEVALCAIEGDSAAQIARFLGRSPATVRRHLETARAALGCDDIADLRRRFGDPELA